MKKITIISIPGLLVALILYISINTFFSVSPILSRLRLDFTEEKLYTLSAETRKILGRIEEPIELHFFLSERLKQNIPVYASYGQRVRDLLVEIASVSNGGVVLIEHNPLSFSEEEDLAVQYGIQGVPLDQGDGLVYFGLSAINTIDKTEVIPFFQPEREMMLEYDLVKIIHSLTNFEAVKVGVLSSLPVMGDMAAAMQGRVMVPWGVGARLKEGFNVVNLPETIGSLPQDLDLLVVIHPRQISERMIYEIEQFMFRGGRAIFFIDPKAESDMSMQAVDGVSSSNGFDRLFGKWGIQISTDQLVADRSLALKINAGSASRPIPAEYVLWMSITDQYLTQDDPITSQLKVLNIASPGYISVSNDSLLKMTPLVQSTQNSSLIALEKAKRIRPDILELLNTFVPDDHVYTIAARFSGAVSTAFGDKIPQPLAEEAGKNTEHLERSRSSINFMLVADSDLLSDRFWIQQQQFYGRIVNKQIADNANFLINAVEHLSGSEELLNLRSRGVSRRSLEKIATLRLNAEQTLQTKKNQLLSTLQETQKKIASLEGISSAKDPVTGELKVAVALTGRQRAEIQLLRKDMLSIRKQLRQIQRGLREEIEALAFKHQFISIGLFPGLFLLALVGIGIRKAVGARHHRTTKNRV